MWCVVREKTVEASCRPHRRPRNELKIEDENKNESPLRAVAFPAPAARHVYRSSVLKGRKLRRSDIILRGDYAAPTELGFVGVARL